MGKGEKIKLREEVSKATPKDARELLGTNDMLPAQQDIRQPSSTSNSSILLIVVIEFRIHPFYCNEDVVWIQIFVVQFLFQRSSLSVVKFKYKKAW